MRSMFILGGCLTVLGLAATACGGDDEGASKDDYVDAMSRVEEGDPFTEDESRCVSGAVVDVVGLDTLNENDVLDKAGEDPDGSLADYGVEVSDDQREELGGAVGDCFDIAAAMVEELSADPSVGPEMAECLAEQIPAETWEQVLVTGIVSDDEEAAGDEELMAEMQAAGQSCVPGG